MKLSRARIGAIGIAVGIALWGAALFLGLPFLYSRKVQALIGQPVDVVRRELGPPKTERDIPDAGLVFEYSEGEQGWRLTFDASGKLVSTERYGNADAGE